MKNQDEEIFHGGCAQCQQLQLGQARAGRVESRALGDYSVARPPHVPNLPTGS